MAKRTTQPKSNAMIAQVGGTHYEKCTGLCPHCGGEVQHWDLYAAQPYLEGIATGYITRWRVKGGVEDLRKAVSVIEKLIAVENLKA